MQTLKRMLMIVGSTAAMTLMAGAPGVAQAGGLSACSAEMEKFCKDVQPGKGRVMRCLKAQDAELSDACKTQIKQMRDFLQKRDGQLGTACEAEMKKFCADVKPGGGRLIKCLKSHGEELSDDCKAWLTRQRQQAKKKPQAAANPGSSKGAGAKAPAPTPAGGAGAGGG